ncbi:hypothetical protein TREMEDRAFT_65719 [Tremella mesenterica DSM 1558]|uniref:uncharacterized protein n=1 Tax=Tremella mesenterica (strain ATCC 24925 / CBS 8224 / DSM 1558 / NBRC 9311 / NRRL Y-6157 / RJB 2259-6 / UBC 559-6) TaxID=578456 RepID=UPI00032BF0B4|nr:uncharacterized protein TREMEDRAFT_65719 [Tremella mesenterica DSM 1558]EIW66126.1 hypothetical protein TREMEDRAFT_65719 [Tremella mesenterica DSM 1558]
MSRTKQRVHPPPNPPAKYWPADTQHKSCPNCKLPAPWVRFREVVPPTPTSGLCTMCQDPNRELRYWMKMRKAMRTNIHNARLKVIAANAGREIFPIQAGSSGSSISNNSQLNTVQPPTGLRMPPPHILPPELPPTLTMNQMNMIPPALRPHLNYQPPIGSNDTSDRPLDVPHVAQVLRQMMEPLRSMSWLKLNYRFSVGAHLPQLSIYNHYLSFLLYETQSQQPQQQSNPNPQVTPPIPQAISGVHFVKLISQIWPGTALLRENFTVLGLERIDGEGVVGAGVGEGINGGDPSVILGNVPQGMNTNMTMGVSTMNVPGNGMPNGIQGSSRSSPVGVNGIGGSNGEQGGRGSKSVPMKRGSSSTFITPDQSTPTKQIPIIRPPKFIVPKGTIHLSSPRP